jgi:hypothetical protein
VPEANKQADAGMSSARRIEKHECDFTEESEDLMVRVNMLSLLTSV